jgi:signal transduction histidine kinase
MDKYIDKISIFALCTVLCLEYRLDSYVVVPFIIVVILSALLSYVENERLNLAAILVFAAVSCFYPIFLFFIPVVCYDVFMTRYQAGTAAAAVPVIVAYPGVPLQFLALIVLFIGLSWLVRRRTALLGKNRREYIALRDTAKELSLSLESKNKELMDKQDYEIRLATLGERNRIARDIHDSVGHVLSNAILQTGALIATCTDEGEKARLCILKETLVSGMESVRMSVHDLHDESVDLFTEIRSLCESFDFCHVTLDFDLDSSPDKKVKYTLIAVLKEALSNIIRHSDATSATVALREHPALYQMAVKDNGSKKDVSGEGIGLKNIAQRVESVGGHVHTGWDNGFLVFVSIPKNP